MSGVPATFERTHDERYLVLLHADAVAVTRLDHAIDTLRYQTLANGVFRRNDHRTIAEVFADHENLRSSNDRREYQQSFDRFTAAQQAATYAATDLIEHELTYTGWQRFFLVVSSAGLVHRSTNCSTCNKGRKATQFALLPTLSGREYLALVQVLGPALCSVCWPTAPTQYTDAARIPVRLAEILFEQGEEAFYAALTVHKAAEAAKANGPHRVKVAKGTMTCAHCGKPVMSVMNKRTWRVSYEHTDKGS